MWKRFKKCTAVLLVLAMVAIAAGPVQTVKAANDKIDFIVKLSDTSVTSGDTIKAEVWLKEGTRAVQDIAGTVDFDASAFTYVEAEEGRLITSNDDIEGILDEEHASEGYLTVLVSNLNDETYFRGGHLYTITLKVNYGSETSGAIGFDMSEATSVTVVNGAVQKDEEGNVVTEVVKDGPYEGEEASETTVVNSKNETVGGGTVTIKPIEGMPGDANGDGKVNLQDARVVAQHCVGLAVSINLNVSDVNKDQKVNLQDARLIAQKAVGMDVELK